MNVFLYSPPWPGHPANLDSDLERIYVLPDSRRSGYHLADFTGDGLHTFAVLTTLKRGGFLIVDPAESRASLLNYMGIPLCHPITQRVITVDEWNRHEE